MQTFLPYADFCMSATVLDDKRLRKQIVETYQVIKALTLPEYGWKHHPAVLMWAGHRLVLLHYQNAMHEQYVRRFNKVHASFTNTYLFIGNYPDAHKETQKPVWLGLEELHLSHRSNLLRKEPEYYRQWWPEDPDNLPYLWPVSR